MDTQGEWVKYVLKYSTCFYQYAFMYEHHFSCSVALPMGKIISFIFSTWCPAEIQILVKYSFVYESSWNFSIVKMHTVTSDMYIVFPLMVCE